ncbi:protein-L-isoaspartate O-methyltransferase family protein [Actinomadura rayongensis]|uniref:Protein-L-isoaspartate O-methyltransferase n=1 Tax=Actinomadura rayongensis TaxID=1429076 RepID=A0A6I4WC20_9ACTN|nr:methyltransferase domain-containing protein [Actinomadura rayongensis]MXQ67737.1 methyltransferase domain-containing protein [Actinomadura rayongensis]
MQRNWQVVTLNRRDFIPDVIWRQPGERQRLAPLDRKDDPQTWERIVAGEGSIITQCKTDRRGLVLPTSSASALWVVRAMLDALALEPGMSVLEIGAGTGYNAALMAEAGARVTTVEIDAELADAASAALERTGFADRVTVVVGDGEHGVPAHAPFDRVIATAGTHTIPPAWVEQTREGGRIVVPYTGIEYAGALLVLTVADGVASGRAVGDKTAFMPLRGQTDIREALRAEPSGPLDRLRVTVTPAGQTVTFE